MKPVYIVSWRGGLNIVDLPYGWSNYDYGQSMTGERDVFIPTQKSVDKFVRYLRSIDARNINVRRIYNK